MRLDILMSIAALAGHFITTTFLLRYLRTFSPVNVHVVSCTSAAAIFVFLGLIFLNSASFNVWPGLALLTFGGMIFLIAYSAIYKSISLRLLITVAQGNSDAVSIERFHSEAVLSPFLNRIKLLAAGGYLSVIGDNIMVTKRGRKLGRTLNRWRLRLGFAQSGLYYEPKSPPRLPNDVSHRCRK